MGFYSCYIPVRFCWFSVYQHIYYTFLLLPWGVFWDWKYRNSILEFNDILNHSGKRTVLGITEIWILKCFMFLWCYFIFVAKRPFPIYSFSHPQRICPVFSEVDRPLHLIINLMGSAAINRLTSFSIRNCFTIKYVVGTFAV